MVEVEEDVNVLVAEKPSAVESEQVPLLNDENPDDEPPGTGEGEGEGEEEGEGDKEGEDNEDDDDDLVTSETTDIDEIPLEDQLLEMALKIYNNKFYMDIIKCSVIFLLALKVCNELKQVVIPLKDYVPFQAVACTCPKQY